MTSGTVSSSAASAMYTLPGGTAVGSYAIQAIYNPGGSLDGSSDTTKSLSVVAPTITVMPTILPGGTVGTAYDQTIGAMGGVGPYTFALTSGTLPAGLTFDTATGVLSGTLLAPGGTFDFTITATDTVSTGSASQAYSVVIGLPLLDMNPLVFPDGILTYSYAQSVTGSGGIGPYTFALSSGALPDGLTLDGTGGAIAGRPEKLGTFTFTLTVTDTVTTATASRDYIIHVLEGPPRHHPPIAAST